MVNRVFHLQTYHSETHFSITHFSTQTCTSQVSGCDQPPILPPLPPLTRQSQLSPAAVSHTPPPLIKLQLFTSRFDQPGPPPPRAQPRLVLSTSTPWVRSFCPTKNVKVSKLPHFWETSSRQSTAPVEIHEQDPLGLFATNSASFDPHPVILPAPIIPSSGPQRTSRHEKGNRKYDPVNPIETRNDVYEGEHENSWDATFVRFRAKLHDIVFNGQPPGGLSPETALTAKIMKLIKEELKRSVSRVFYRVLALRFTNFAILATATSEHCSWRRKTCQERGGLPHQYTEGN